MLNKAKPYIFIAFLTLLSTFILWLPLILRIDNINGIKVSTPDLHIVMKNWDGPLYIAVAKSMYDPKNEIFKHIPIDLGEKYYAAHFPGYPLFIRAIAPFAGYLRGMLIATLLSSIALYCFFYFFVKKQKFTEKPFLLTLVFMVITPRFLAVRSVGSPEPLFMLFILASTYFFLNKKYFFAGILGALAAITKSPGILLFFAYSIAIALDVLKTKKIDIRTLFIGLIPLGLLSVFGLYSLQYHDFFAYFHSGDNIHLVFPPFSVFNFNLRWVDTGWLEEIPILYFFYLSAIVYLYDKKEMRPIFYFMCVFFAAVISINHRDISRYALPLLPFALIAHNKIFTSKKTLICIALLTPAIYLYAINFILYNTAPITDWGPLM
jgi:hypothetical protein